MPALPRRSEWSKTTSRFKAGAPLMPGGRGGEPQRRRRRRREGNREQSSSPAFLEALQAQRQRGSAGGPSQPVEPSTAAAAGGGSSRGGQQPRHIPGFEYDAERQRYFPVGSRPSTASSTPAPPPPRMGGASVEQDPRSRGVGPRVWRGLARGLLRRQEVGPPGLSEARTLDYLTTAVLDLKATCYFSCPGVHQQDFDIRRNRLAAAVGRTIHFADLGGVHVEGGPPAPPTVTLLQTFRTPVSCVRWRPKDDQPPTLAVAETGEAIQPAVVTVYRATEDEIMEASRMDRYTIRRETVRTLAWGSDAAQSVVVGVSRGEPLVVIDVGGGRMQHYGRVSSDVTSCGFFPQGGEGRTVLYGTRNGEVKLADLRSSPSTCTVVAKMDSSVDHHHVLRDLCSVLLSDMGGGMRRADLRMPGRTVVTMDGHLWSLYAPHFAVSPSESYCLTVGANEAVRAYSLSKGGPPLQSWAALPEGIERARGLFLCPSWCGDRSGLLGDVWMGSRMDAGIFRLRVSVGQER